MKVWLVTFSLFLDLDMRFRGMTLIISLAFYYYFVEQYRPFAYEEYNDLEIESTQVFIITFFLMIYIKENSILRIVYLAIMMAFLLNVRLLIKLIYAIATANIRSVIDFILGISQLRRFIPLDNVLIKPILEDALASSEFSPDILREERQDKEMPVQNNIPIEVSHETFDNNDNIQSNENIQNNDSIQNNENKEQTNQ
eukprot:TRINITY_DN14025_c0_g1_i2.p1 TRINITY_DN14025_c0_g1~~TRINITY_DN14025_c0_g1_i2.p1  ORF type:complete len:198 (-),score=34.35 TRINITY_DN14025_c0_g1_i2:133-726(-)